MILTRFVSLAALSLGLVAALPSGSARADLALPRPSPNATVKQTLGITDLTLTYSRPGVKNRLIWGGLVPFEKPWRTGANEATTFTCSDDVRISGQPLAAGTYSFFTIPSPASWTVVFSKQKELWGAFDYDPKQDALRVTATPDTNQSHQEWMTLGFDDLAADTCNLVLRWQRLRLAVPIAVDVNGTVLPRCRSEIAAAKPDDWRTPFRAASWCFDNGQALDEAKGWLDKSLAIQKQHGNLALRARWLMKDGKKADAIAAATEAIAAGKASKERVDTAPTEKLLADWKSQK